MDMVIGALIGLAFGAAIAITAICVYKNAFEKSMEALGSSTAKFIYRQKELMDKANKDSDKSNDR